MKSKSASEGIDRGTQLAVGQRCRVFPLGIGAAPHQRCSRLQGRVPGVSRGENLGRAFGSILFAAIAVLVCSPQDVAAQQFPLELQQDLTNYNLSHELGLPLSNEVGNPAGSNGLGPAVDQNIGAPGANQWRTVITFGHPMKRQLVQDDYPSDASSTDADGVATIFLTQATIAPPFIARASSFLIGSTITPPDEDEDGNALPEGIAPEDYWFQEPNDSGNAYWSPHAGQLFAVESGSLNVVWVKREPETNQPADLTDYLTVGTSFFRLYEKTYVVSGSGIKDPQKIFWNTSPFAGPGVDLPGSRIGDVYFAYSDSFPEEVLYDEDTDGDGVVDDIDGNGLIDDDVDPRLSKSSDSFKRTIWIEQIGLSSQIRAQNVEGRIFMEILGDIVSSDDGFDIREHLGFEIVDVLKYPTPSDLTVELGDPVIPPSEREGLFPVPVDVLTSSEFFYQHSVASEEIPSLYAVHETENANDLLIHWMQEGVESIRWPTEFVRYLLGWPRSIESYSHYMRPMVATEDEAKATAIALSAQNVPFIEFQDVIDGPIAKITEDTRFYTFMDEALPVHRSLLRFTVDDNVAFERVMSWNEELVGMVEEAEPYSPPTTLNLYRNGSFEYENGDVTSLLTGPIAVQVSDDGNLAYVVTSGSDTAFILDVSDPENVSILGDLTDTLDPGLVTNGRHLLVNGNTMYVAADSDNRVHVINIEDPRKPVLTQTIRYNVAGEQFVEGIRHFSMEGDLLYVSATDVDALVVFQVSESDPHQLEFVAEIVDGQLDVDNEEIELDAVRASVVEDGIAYVVSFIDSGGVLGVDVAFSIIDVTDPSNPDLLGALVEGVNGIDDIGDPRFLDVHDGIAYLAGRRGDSVTIVDVSNPLAEGFAPEVLHVIQNGVDGYSFLDEPEGIYVENDLLYIAGHNSDGLTIVDVSDPRNPVLLDELAGADYGFDGPYGIDVDGGKIYVTSLDGDALTIIEWQDPRWGWKADAFVGTLAEELDEFENFAGNLPILHISEFQNAPKIIRETVEVGDRIEAPSSSDHLAGFVQPVLSDEGEDIGDSYSSSAYRNPLDPLVGFDLAERGSIIPINEIPGEDELIIHWFRRGGGDSELGFDPIYWPAYVGYYDIEWPSAPREIVLASNLGSNDGLHGETGGGLSTLQEKGTVYTQNLRSLPGYNPNEEHALMSAGEVYALRDDLNIVSGDNFSSEPFVLLEYEDDDGRPSMIPFKVLREKPELGQTFKYDREAGIVLQAPMPLPLLANPVPEDEDRSLNSEAGEQVVEDTFLGTETGEVSLVTLSDHRVVPFNIYALQRGDLGASTWIYVDSADYSSDLVGGFVSSILPITLSPWELTAPADPTTTLRLHIDDLGNLEVNDSVRLFSEASGMSLAVDITAIGTEEGTNFVDLPIAEADQVDFELLLVLIVPDGSVVADQFNDWVLRRSPLPANVPVDKRDFYAGFTRQDRKGNVWFYRGPHSDDDAPAMDMQFYYPTQEGFWFPELDADGVEQPGEGTLTPYLRIKTGDETYQGDGVYALDQETGEALNQALPIAYRPFWPDEIPVMKMAQTLTTTISGLPAIRGNSSLELIYEQSQIAGQLSVLLHDSTREKEYYLNETNLIDSVEFYLEEIPASVETTTYNGDVFFPGLPPHLESRFFMDPNRGSDGALVFRGEHRDETVGEDYVLLNVLSITDLETLQALVPDDEDETIKTNWDYAIENLAATVDLFVEDPAVPGTHVSVASIRDRIDSIDTETPDDVYYDENGDLSEIGLSAVDAILGLEDYHSGIEHLAQDLIALEDDDEAVDSYSLTAMGPGSGYISLIAGDGEAFTESGDPVSLLIIQVDPDLHPGELKVILSDSPLAEKVTVQQAVDLASMTELYDVEWMVGAPVDGTYPALDRSSDHPGSGWISLGSSKHPDKIRAIVGDTADVQSLSDQYLIMRYRANVNTHASWVDDGVDLSENLNWSQWTDPEAGGFVEGWIKRVLAGINPFNQRTTDLFNNAVDTDASMLTLAGPRWEGNVALNSDTINDFGLIEIYETVLNRGRDLSIDAGVNYGPANDALLLAASYINDLYMFVGNEAYADALNPTIGIGTADGALGDVATALFAFKGQTASLLEEELALLRGRDDFLPPGVQANPVYNRLFWNYTRGIDSGEVIYAQNYNIQEDNNSDFDGVIDAEDAAVMFPQGHGDAYGHYLTAMKGYYSLLMDTDFEWVPRTEAVTILGQTVQVDYTDERKFAAAAASVAETGKNVLDLTWRQDYETGSDVGWEHFGAEAIRANDSKGTARYWGVDHWASRTGQGAFINWVAGNAMLPDVDDDPTHEGIQVIDRTTVPELEQIAVLGRDIQASMDSADAHLNPLGLADDSVAFDINPHAGLALGGETHFEQILDRAKTALNNAVIAFDDAKDVTQLMRSETDSLAELQTDVDSQEAAYESALIEIYGTPYADDIGVGQTYETGYDGPDFLHYMYVDKNEFTSPLIAPEDDTTFAVDIQDYTSDFQSGDKSAIEFILKNLPSGADDGLDEGVAVINYTLDSHGFFEKPDFWSGRRESPGKLQSVISDIVKARNAANLAFRSHETVKYELDRMLEVADAQGEVGDQIGAFEEDIFIAESFLNFATYANDLYDLANEHAQDRADAIAEAASAALPEVLIAGFATGFDPSAAVDAQIKAAKAGAEAGFDAIEFARAAAFGAYEAGLEETVRFKEFYEIGDLEGQIEDLAAVYEVDMKFRQVQMSVHQVNEAVQNLADAQSAYQKLLADGNRIQSEREVFRRRAAALTQGFRTRDAAFRIFRDEKLERYQALFGLAAQYAFLAAKAFDYETGLLHSDQGLDFINRIVEARALGVVTDGEPQFAGSETGDPGLSSALAEMAAEWQVLKARLGMNNPDVYGTTVSLRTEHFRIIPGSDGDTAWRDELYEARTANVLEDEDVLRHCMQIDLGDGLPVPGIILEFSTEITSGNNLFGQPLAGGDHAFDVSSFATKIFSVGVGLEGYNGMDNPSLNASVTDSSSVADPTAAFLDTTMLSATPTVYLIPAGLDAMRSPPLGDQSVIRTWSVEDVTIPMPFNIGGSEFSTKKLYQSTDSLTEELFSVRKHQAFRPVSDVSVFGANAELAPSVYTNNRLVGRSVWNTRWKLVIPGRSLLNDPENGLDVLIDSLSDIKIHFETYSYAGN